MHCCRAANAPGPRHGLIRARQLLDVTRSLEQRVRRDAGAQAQRRQLRQRGARPGRGRKVGRGVQQTRQLGHPEANIALMAHTMSVKQLCWSISGLLLGVDSLK